MTSSSPVSKVPLWLFLVTDAVLFAIAGYIGAHTPAPWPQGTTFAVVVLVIAGAAVGLVPLVIRYERQKNELLDDRQRALESLARTLTSSAEQISIATGGLHEIAELAQKNLKHAEQLPHKLQEKIAEFQAQLASANDTEKEELEKELEELRASETERLQSTSDKIAKTVAEFAKLEAATQQHLNAANEAVSKLAFNTAGAIGKAQVAAEQALSQARQEASRLIGDATGNAVKAVDAAKAAALTEIAAQFDAGVSRFREAGAQFAATIANVQVAPPSDATPSSMAPTASTAVPPPTPEAAPTESTAATTATPTIEPPAAPPKRPRKPRREEPSVSAEPTPAPESPAESAPPAPDISAAAPTVEPPVANEPAPVPPEHIAEIAPIAPQTAEPFPGQPAPVPTPAADEPAKPARKRAPKKPGDDEPSLGLEIESTNGDAAAPGVVERVLTSDGATRLIVTAYIGIGNRLFIRGAGPGLSWDKGVPLQFVSIGKWRWETNDATGPVQLKLLKNDEQECAGLGTLTIDPGHQHEVTANFA
jgi:hypothetical protein